MKGEFELKYKEIKKYLYGGYIVRNEEYEYKVSKGDNIYCRQIGCETWNSIISIPDYEKEQEWELVGKKKWFTIQKQYEIIANDRGR